MKLRTLHIQNVASFADVSIDFSAEPLASTPLFLIAGDVGSGKSTILDAITLALYNRTPRLNDKSTRRGALDNEFEGHKAGHTVNLVRRGQRHASVTLDFEADGHTWRASWTASAKARSATLKLTDITTGEVFEKEAQKAEVLRLTGLNFEQFCRTTILAQGAFSEFLKANEDEKSEILEKILDDDRFSRIGRTIYRLATEAGQRLRDAEKDIMRIQTMTPDERTTAEAERLKLEVDAKELKDITTSLTEEIAWLVQHSELQRQLAEAKSAYRSAQFFDSTDEIQVMRKDIADYDATSEVRAAMSTLYACSDDMVQVCTDLSLLATNFSRALGLLESARANSLCLTRQRDAVGEELKQHHSRTIIYDSFQTIVKDAETYTNLIKERDQATKRSAAIRKELSDNLLPAHKKHEEKLLETSATLEKAVKEYNEALTALENSGISSLRTKQAEISERLNTLKTVKIYCDIIDKETVDAQRWQTEIEKCQSLIATLPAQIKTAEDNYTNLTDQSTKLSQELSIRRMAIEDIVVKIRARLRPGDDCPVCGRPVDTHLPIDEAVRETIAEQERELAVLDKHLQEARMQLARLNATLDDARSNLRIAENHRKDALQRIKDTNQRVSDPSLLNRDNLSTATLQAQKEKAVNDGCLRNAEEIEQRAHSIRKSVDKLRIDVEKAKSVQAASQKFIDTKNAEAITCDALAQSKRSDASRTLNAIMQTVSAHPNYISLAHNNIAKLVAVLEEDLSRHLILSRQAEELDNRISALDKEIEHASYTATLIIKDMSSWADIEPVTSAPDEASDAAMASLKASLDLVFERRRVIENRSNAAKSTVSAYLATEKAVSEERLHHLYSLTGENVSVMRKRNLESHTALSNALTTLQHIEKRTAIHASSCPPRIVALLNDGQDLPLAEDLRQELDERKSTLDAANLRLGHLMALLQEDDSRTLQIEQLRERHQQAKLLADKWSTLNRMFGSDDGKRFRCIALSFVLGSLIEAANKYMERLSNRYRLQLIPGTYVILVEDRFDGGRRRQITTLSGGETFIVSLALALALSDIGEVSGSDILFIDEGLGSLAGEDLYNAIHTLQSLQSLRARRVGIISHIPDVAERISVRIRVERPAASAQSTIHISPQT